MFCVIDKKTFSRAKMSILDQSNFPTFSCLKRIFGTDPSACQKIIFASWKVDFGPVRFSHIFMPKTHFWDRSELLSKNHFRELESRFWTSPIFPHFHA